MARRESRQKSRQSVATQFIDQAAHDAETVRLVREWANKQKRLYRVFGIHAERDGLGDKAMFWAAKRSCGKDILAILNRNPAAKKGGKR